MAIILSDNSRSRELFNLQSTARGKIIKEVIVENDALQLTCFVASLAKGANLSIVIEQVGNNAENVKLLHRFQIIDKVSDVPSTDIYDIGGVVRITVEYTGAITFDMTGRAVSGAVATLSSTQDVSISLTDEDKTYREEHLQLLCKILDIQETILNHQRAITNLEKDKGDKY